MRYIVPRMWVGETAVVMASGPSMSAEVARIVAEAGVRSVVVSDTYRLAPWADILYAADRRWWEANPEAATEFRGVKLVGQSGVVLPDVHVMQRSGTDGFDPNPGFVRTGNNSGYAAVHVAAHTGAARILLCGFDMHGTHWFGNHTKRTPTGARLSNPHESSFARWIARFHGLRGCGAEILNCTPGSRIDAFPFVELEEALGVNV